MLAPTGARSAGVTHLDAAQVRAAFAKGTPLLETAGYKVHASRRDAPGEAEVHETDTDVIYVLEGRATFVVGGTLEGARAVAAGELRAPAIRDGETRALAPGDVVVVPQGTPHWFRAIEGPVVYYVVKVTGPKEQP